MTSDFCQISDVKIKNDFDAETEVIHKLISDTSKNLDEKVKRIMNVAKAAWKDRDDLTAKIGQLNKELSILQKTKASDTSSTDLKDKLNKERAARESLKHMVATAEGLLRTARGRITVLERELKTTQKQMQDAMRKNKEFELLHRSRQTSYGVRSKKLMEETKSGEETIEMLTLQRKALELRVTELQEQIKLMRECYEDKDSNNQSNLDRLQQKLDEEFITNY
ncbi:protein hook-like [Cydia fagiglandana]|uniref:protein hook-like n=1 Tax=Cydia fagiglandana TaxID=1458189 RepID=UPI002FEE0703